MCIRDRKSIISDLSDGEVRGDKDQSLIIVSTDEEKGYPCYAANKKGFRCDGSQELLNAETQAEVQLWKYDPATVSYTHLDVYKRQQLSRTSIHRKLLRNIR